MAKKYPQGELSVDACFGEVVRNCSVVFGVVGHTSEGEKDIGGRLFDSFETSREQGLDECVLERILGGGRGLRGKFGDNDDPVEFIAGAFDGEPENFHRSCEVVSDGAHGAACTVGKFLVRERLSFQECFFEFLMDGGGDSAAGHCPHIHGFTLLGEGCKADSGSVRGRAW